MDAKVNIWKQKLNLSKLKKFKKYIFECSFDIIVEKYIQMGIGKRERERDLDGPRENELKCPLFGYS